MRWINGVSVSTTIDELVDPPRTALLVIDMMNIVVAEIASTEGGKQPASTASTESIEALVAPIRRLIDAARSRGLTIAYAEFIQRNRLGATLMDGPNMYCHKDADHVVDLVEGSDPAKTIPELTPQEGDLVIRKSRGSAFYHTPLDDLLRARGVSNVILTGVLSSGCVLFTACDSMHHGYYPIIARQCVGTYDPVDHERAMGWMETKFPVFDLEEILDAWRQAGVAKDG